MSTLIKRPSKDITFMAIAVAWAQQSTCSSKIAVGAVLVNEFNQVIASGFNGSPRHFPHCDDVGCDDDGHYHRVIHAEENALLQCAFVGTSSRNSVMYVTHPPCVRCSLRIAQAGVLEVVYLHEYNNVSQQASQVLGIAGITLRRLIINEGNTSSPGSFSLGNA